jgi:hypothetical protein
MARNRKVEEMLESALSQTKVEAVLQEAEALSDLVVIGFNEEGEMSLYSTLTEGPQILWAIELAKSQILEMGQPTDD